MLLNFKILIDILKMKKVSQEKTYFLLLFTSVNLYVTNLHTYTSLMKLNYTNVEDNSLFVVVSTLSYLDI
jgi:hypothetical protein